MAQISKLRDSKPLPTDIKGIYIHNLPAKRMQDLFGDLETRLANDPEVVVVQMFNELVCDEDGNTFEDVATYDQIMSALSIKDIQDIMRAIAATVNPAAKDLGK